MIDLTLAIILATAGQIVLSQHDLRGLGLYALAILSLVGALRRDKQRATGRRANPKAIPQRPSGYHRLWRLMLLPLALTSATLAFLWASNNTYRWYGIVAWLLAVGLFLLLFWERSPGRPRRWLGFDRDGWHLSWTSLAVIGLVLVGFWFRFWRLAELPPEMTSDQIEKLLDVHDLVSGQRPIFFVRNTGREPWQFYWTLMFIRLFDLDTKFFALKLGTAAVSLLTLPGVYLLGRELFGRWVGLWATLFTAVASWPVILSRVGLRFPFAPAVTAWSLLYLLRGLRDGQRNDFLLLGIWLGIGIHGYTAFRAMPLAVAVCWGLAWLLSLRLRRRSAAGIANSSVVPRSGPSSLLRNGLLTVLIALVVFIPLGRFSLEHPADFWQRSFSRIADPDQPMPDGPLLTFLKNLWNQALMFHWEGDDVWVNTLENEPVLDPLLGGLLVLGSVIALWRGLRLRDLSTSLLLISGAILILPSALSLAYPIEIPSVVRTGGAIPAVMTLAALPVGLWMERNFPTLRAGAKGLMPQGWRRWLLALGALALAVAVTAINYKRYFSDYREQYYRRALNTTEIAATIRGFIDSGGDAANAWIIAWPHWIDTRGAGIEIGDPTWNNVILEIEELEAHVDQPRPRFYVLYRDDRTSRERLQALFPEGWTTFYISERRHRNFYLFYVPPEKLGPAALRHPPTSPVTMQSSQNELKGMTVYAP
jgi:hypothetical protein